MLFFFSCGVRDRKGRRTFGPMTGEVESAKSLLQLWRDTAKMSKRTGQDKRTKLRKRLRNAEDEWPEFFEAEGGTDPTISLYMLLRTTVSVLFISFPRL